jgi:predicted permease
MFRHNLLLIFRSFKRYRSTSIINLIGLSTGLASALLIYLWVNDEFSIDKFHEKDSRLYQVMENRLSGDGVITGPETSGPVAEVLAKEMPEVQYVAIVAPPTWRGFDGFILSVGENNIKATGQYAGKDYFNIFSYGLMHGDADQVLADKNALVISDELAMKLFNTTEGVVGKVIELQHEKEFVVSGIFSKIPSASSVWFDFVLSFEAYDEIAPWYRVWYSTGPNVYVVLREGSNLDAFNEKIADLIQNKTNGEVTHRKLFLASYSDFYLYGNYENGVQSGGRIEYVTLFSIIALFILIIACINFMNLSTARAAVRTKEVGVKKALGAGRKRLAIQYLAESMLMTFLSLLIAIALVSFILPQFNLITGKQLTLAFDVRLVVSVVCIVFVTGLIAGSYPALYLSGFNPVMVLKGKLKTSISEVWIRKGLVTFQFTLSIILIVSVLVVFRQIEFVQNNNLGYDKENVIYLNVEGSLAGTTATFLSEIKRMPGIINATSTTHDMTGHNWSIGLGWEGRDPDNVTDFQVMVVNHDFLETLGMEMKEGRFFSRDFSADTTKIVFNEAAIKAMGFKDPVGRTVNVLGRPMEIIGVVKNFHFDSFHQEVNPQFFTLHRKGLAPTLMMARIEAGKEKETIEKIGDFYQSYNPGFPFDYRFLDEDYEALYASEQRVSVLSRYFAGLAILISCLGLFGLAAFTAQRRIKEIGIRKILGASDYGIVRLLTGDFTQIVLVAITVGLPLSYFIAWKWLEGYAYRIDLEWWFFASAGLAAMLIAWLTVGLQTFKAASINPTLCLKEE